ADRPEAAAGRRAGEEQWHSPVHSRCDLPRHAGRSAAGPPLFGATVKSFDASAAKTVPGVVGVLQVPRGVAVVGKSFWAAKQGRDSLRVAWDDSKAEKRSSDAI